MRIIGIDPGSRVTGYGVIDCAGPQLGYVVCGTIRTSKEPDFCRRLLVISEGLEAVVAQYGPETAAIEEVFMANNPSSALKLGHARGAAAVAVLRQGIDVHSYSPRKIKQAVVGYGQAAKSQVQHMVQALLELDGTPSTDAADALAVAICHAHYLVHQAQIGATGKMSSRSWRAEVNFRGLSSVEQQR
jgi:crossover junction endodeoxyribonuclease RuvC